MERRMLDHDERRAVRLLVDAAVRERLQGKGTPHVREGLLHGSAMPWPPLAVRGGGPSVDPTEDYVRLGLAEWDYIEWK